MKGWYEVNKSNTVLVFIHGLFSNSDKCWKSKSEIFWPDLILDDGRFCTPSIFLAEFYTSPTANDYGIQECAKEIHSLLLRVDEHNNSPPISKENIIFVTHSTGGIVARYILDTFRGSFLNKNIGVCLFASPSYGSKIPFLVKAASRIVRNQLVDELSWESAILKDLDGRFIELLRSKELNLLGIEAYENNPPFSLPIINYRVVNKESAARYFHTRKMMPNTDHSSIVKPTTMTCSSHVFLLDFLVNEKLLTSLESITPLSSPSLFLLYKPEFEEYFIERTVDTELDIALSLYSVWACGDTGTGKTCSIFRSLHKNNMSFKYISLGTSIGSTVYELFENILVTLTDDFDIQTRNITDCINKISSFITKVCNEDKLVIFIEEIPISSSEMFEEFSSYIYSLISSVNSEGQFKLILSSIYKPIIDKDKEQLKINEKLKIIEWSRWNQNDIKSLVGIIIENTKMEAEFNIDTFEGMPRNVKSFYKIELAKQGM